MRHAMSLLVVALFLTGCGSDGQGNTPGSVRNRQDDAMRDPFNYGPSYNEKNLPDEPGPFKESSAKDDWDRIWR